MGGEALPYKYRLRSSRGNSGRQVLFLTLWSQESSDHVILSSHRKAHDKESSHLTKWHLFYFLVIFFFTENHNCNRLLCNSCEIDHLNVGQWDKQRLKYFLKMSLPFTWSVFKEDDWVKFHYSIPLLPYSLWSLLSVSRAKNVVCVHWRRKLKNPELECGLSREGVRRVQLCHCHMTQRCVTMATEVPGWSLTFYYQRVEIKYKQVMFFFVFITLYFEGDPCSYFWDSITLVFCL